MSEYKKPYLHLFNQVSQIIEDLQKAQQKCEELFIDGASTEDVEITGGNSGDT